VAQLRVHRETKRLLLRPFTSGDLYALTDLYARDDVNRYLYWEPMSKEQVVAVLQSRLGRPDDVIEKNVLPIAVVLRANNRLVGDFVLRWSVNEHRQGEIGGSLHPDVHGQGFATEVYDVLLSMGFFEYDLHRIVGRCDARNVASIRSLEKVGMRQEAHLVENEFVKGEWTDEVILAIRRDEWRARNRALSGEP
jgi:RimJ/RimL family protein N-acetyltransferase